jgi:hypothetical protein
MDSYGSTREVEKVPTTRTARHTALYNECVRRIGILKTQSESLTNAFGDTPLAANLNGTIELLLALSRELKPDTRDRG